LQDSLVRLEQGAVVKAAPDALAGKSIIAIYYSAHWCPPCRAFTPELVKFYDETRASHPNFELIFVSSDKSAAEMKTYLNWGKMNWLALEYSKRKTPMLAELAAKGIPYLIVLDADGKVLISRPEGQDWVAPQTNLAQLKKLLKKP
jgi:nucleoredoxin